MKRSKLAILLTMACAALLPTLVSADTVVEEIIARVNNEIITRSEYVRSRDQLEARGPAAGTGQCRPCLCRKAGATSCAI